MRFTNTVKSERIDDEHIKLLEPFGFEDPRGIKWNVEEGFVSDGASIPKWLRPIVGHPFEGNFIEAAIIHDKYCKTKIRSQRDTHRAFREALKLDGVSWVRRWIMWSGVRAYNKALNFKWR